MTKNEQADIHNVDDLARRAAAFLATEHPGVVPQVEAELQTRGATSGPPRFDPATMIALGSLVVAAAQFAYQIWRDRQKDQQLAPDVLKRRVRIALDDQGYPDTVQRAKVIDAVTRAVQDAQG
jgi:hypothetical protein